MDPVKLGLIMKQEVFDEPEKSVAQLTLLAAVAPWQIDESSINRFRQYFPEDHLILSTFAWGSFSAARKIGTWIRISNL